MRRINIFYLLITILVLITIVIPLSPTPAQAASKEEVILVRLQNDVLKLQDQVRDLDKTFSEKIDGLKSLIVQLNDQVAKSNLTLNKISTALENQSSGAGSKDQQLLQAIGALATKVDDNATRVSALAQQISELKVQSQAISQASQSAATASITPESVYSTAIQDLNQGNYDLAIRGFTAYLDNFPTANMAAAAQLNIGEAYLIQNKLPQAISALTSVINSFPNSDKVASALYKRGKAEMGMKEKDNAIEDFRNVIKTYPNATEAALAKRELQELGVGITPAKQPTRKIR
jgi:tol-pal system protein YbgF